MLGFLVSGWSPGRRTWLGTMLVLLLALRGMAQAQSLETPSPPIAPTNAPAGDTAVAWTNKDFVSFSKSVVVTPIAVVSNMALQIGNSKPMVLTRVSGNPSKPDRKLVAMDLGVSAGVVDRLLDQFAQNPQIQISDLAQELRAATIEFRFLLAEMTSGEPSAQGQQAKSEALQALLLGHPQKARDLYDELSRPARPARPTGLRIVAP